MVRSGLVHGCGPPWFYSFCGHILSQFFAFISLNCIHFLIKPHLFLSNGPGFVQSCVSVCIKLVPTDDPSLTPSQWELNFIVCVDYEREIIEYILQNRHKVTGFFLSYHNKQLYHFRSSWTPQTRCQTSVSQGCRGRWGVFWLVLINDTCLTSPASHDMVLSTHNLSLFSQSPAWLPRKRKGSEHCQWHSISQERSHLGNLKWMAETDLRCYIYIHINIPQRCR